MFLRKFVFIITSCLLASTQVNAIAAPGTAAGETHTQRGTGNVISKAPSYVFWQGEASEARRPFEAELMHMIFRLSEPKFGPANLEISQWDISTLRSLQLMRDGEKIQIQIAPFFIQFFSPDAVKPLPFPVMKNLLGYRQLVVRREDLDKFRNIQSKEEFTKLSSGQGPGWGDTFIFRSNKIRVFEAPDFLGMFAMLDHKRFDYIPLGVTEIKETMAQPEIQSYNFAVVDNVLLHYPWPFHIIVSKKHPELATRLEYGMRAAMENGEYDALFQRYFGDLINELNSRHNQVIQLGLPEYMKMYETKPTLMPSAQVHE